VLANWVFLENSLKFREILENSTSIEHFYGSLGEFTTACNFQMPLPYSLVRLISLLLIISSCI
jgi:hypothetical protein